MRVRLTQHIIAVIALSIAVFGGAAWFVATPPSSSAGHIVELREDGFHPATLTIERGETVTFKATARAGWPASDPHPTHEYLGGFDADRVIPVGESWSYTFDEPGTWRYHDHEAPSFEGEITVVNPDSLSGSSAAAAANDCDGECFDSIIRTTVQNEGIDAAFALFQKTFDSGTLPRSCHWTAHQIGEEAYELFKTGKDFPITEATSYCAYGFFHGFLEGLLRENPDVDYALSFCGKVEEQLGLLGLQNCYHGIGHGFTEDPPDPRVEGDFQAMIEPGIEVCEFLFRDSFTNLNLCLTGVFTVPAGFAAKNEYGLSMDPDDPFAFCRTQPDRYQKACYGEFAPKLDVVIDWDLSRLPAYVDQVPVEQMKELVVWVVPSVLMARDIQETDHTQYVTGCRKNFEGKMRELCFGGTILGFFNQGDPGEEYRPALRLCAADELLDAERVLCYEETFHRMSQSYSDQKKDQICGTLVVPYRERCLGDDHQSIYQDPTPQQGRWQDIVTE